MERESPWDDGDSIDYTQDDCSVEFEQGLPDRDQPLLDVALDRLNSHFLSRVMG
jgi:hypothetical protein